MGAQSSEIRPYRSGDAEAVWSLLAPVIRDGRTYALPRDMTREEALAYWTGGDRAAFVVVENDAILGSYFLKANQQGGGSHVANCGYITAEAARGRGLARKMCRDSMARAVDRGFSAMQFNFVVADNIHAVRLWRELGFVIVGTIPDAFRLPDGKLVDAFTMHRFLADADRKPA